MKPDAYTKLVLTIIAILLLDLVARPAVQSVRAASATHYRYELYVFRPGDSGIDDALRWMNEKNCEQIAAVPTTGVISLLNSAASGTSQIYVFCGMAH